MKSDQLIQSTNLGSAQNRSLPQVAADGGTLNPHVFKKKRQGTKSVDINICVDATRHVSQSGLVTVVLVTGDGDYLPLIQELMRRGVDVEVQALSDGCHSELKYVPDSFRDLDRHFSLMPPKLSDFT